MDSLIQIKDLVKNYKVGDIEVHALRRVSLEIRKNSFVAIMGPSGSGKSTFMNILGCLDKPCSGSYHLDGVSVEKMERDQLAEIRNKKIGFVFQQFNLLSRTSALENVQLPLLYSDHDTHDLDERARKVLRAVGLAGREDHHPSQLSGGQQQRVAIARSMISSPQIILADEPTGALDSRTSIEIMAIFQELNRKSGITIIVVTHEQDIAEYSERIIHFKDGKIVSDEAVAKRREAAQELAELPAIEDDEEKEEAAVT